jgi:hypothetical protein
LLFPPTAPLSPRCGVNHSIGPAGPPGWARPFVSAPRERSFAADRRIAVCDMRYSTSGWRRFVTATRSGLGPPDAVR